MKRRIIYTKSVLKKASKQDGLRVCVMRRIKPEYKFDIWIPTLGPSAPLLKKYVVDKTISWDVFSAAYKKQLIYKRLYLELLETLLQKSRVTILCIEEKAGNCHRSLIALECARRDPNLKIIHR